MTSFYLLVDSKSTHFRYHLLTAPAMVSRMSARRYNPFEKISGTTFSLILFTFIVSAIILTVPSPPLYWDRLGRCSAKTHNAAANKHADSLPKRHGRLVQAERVLLG